MMEGDKFMQNDNKYLIATAEIDGKIEEFYRDGKKEGFYIHKNYTSKDIIFLQSSIQDNLHIIKFKFSRVGYFYSDDLGFCKLYLPEIICELLKKEFKMEINACGQGNNFIVYTDKINYIHARDRFNEHFKGNL